jgi:hypothetical protein
VVALAAVLLVHAAVPAASARLTGGVGGMQLSRALADAVLAAAVAPVLFALLNRLPTGRTADPARG